MEKVCMNINEIKKIIPHREPMLLVDEVLELEAEKEIVTRWFIAPEREIFCGHFPEEAVLPGVYTVENMAQTADILILSMPRYTGKVPLFLGVDQVKFLAKLKPGDTIVTRATLHKERTQKAIVTCACEVYHDDILACIGQVTLAMR